MEDTALPPWYKSRGRIFLFILLGLVLIFLVAFLSFFGYYFWKIKQGQAKELGFEFQTEEFTYSGRQTSAADSLENIGQYIRAFNPMSGNPKAPVTIVAFIDFECPFSQAGYSLFARIMDKYAPVARVVFKQFPIASLHPNSLPAAKASACAQEQGKFWPYYDRLFRDKALDRNSLLSQAEKVGIKSEAFVSCFDGHSHEADIDQDIADGLKLGVRGTPTYFVNQRKIEGVVDEAVWDKIILESLRSR